MKWIIPAVIIGLVGGLLDSITTLGKFWCFLLGVAAYIVFVLLKSIITTAKIMRRTKGKKKIWLNQNNNIIKSE